MFFFFLPLRFCIFASEALNFYSTFRHHNGTKKLDWNNYYFSWSYSLIFVFELILINSSTDTNNFAFSEIASRQFIPGEFFSKNSLDSTKLL